ncbi:ABC transporter ATP-binding protein [Desulfocucumis palustris]|uniref:ABC transporter ATP-binding protein n=1 Tax=Desulfocucumis palustris TaxID=1898651 RepID=A0A2L2XGA7_9FIRM|nr:ATP-binding cassette domain-containing protein [Desulfocucumis palustris]GBF35172.1 ABC transporter ATP-binding protein [Desulfocucumis palustris]
MWGIEVNNVTKKAILPDGTSDLLFENFNLRVKESEVVGIFGPNGCGKTTLLNMVSGISRPDSGEILIFGEKPGEKRIAYIFQDYRSSLFPWLTVRDNIVFPLSLRKMNKRDIDEKLNRMAENIKISFDMAKYPYQLSGGQQQYISILRGLISDPVAMLIDEPFSALDYSNSLWLMKKMSEIMDAVKIPAILVAHDINHLMRLSHRICFFSKKPTGIIKERHIKSDRAWRNQYFKYNEILEAMH